MTYFHVTLLFLFSFLRVIISTTACSIAHLYYMVPTNMSPYAIVLVLQLLCFSKSVTGLGLTLVGKFC